MAIGRVSGAVLAIVLPGQGVRIVVIAEAGAEESARTDGRDGMVRAAILVMS
ncbi:hypothetical protein ACFWY9_29280 [Amycolatopsis sp. NPDC059027]|uniref:hypothetical protein n=1 Tax=Amycolatopsis sp. NPDC059027 TaxID=3346709 RepID=UPI0036710B93